MEGAWSELSEPAKLDEWIEELEATARVGTRTLRPGSGFTANFAVIDVHFLLHHPPNSPPLSLNIPQERTT